MRRILITWLAICGVLFGAWQAFAQLGQIPGWPPNQPAGCSQATTANAAMDGSQNKAAVTSLICNLVSEGVLAKLDVMYLFAINSSGNALINVVNPGTYNGTNSSGTFSANAGYAGADALGSHIDTGFNPTTATSPHFAQNFAHLSVLSNTNTTSSSNGGVVAGLQNSGSTAVLLMYPKYSDGNFYIRPNEGSSNSAGVANSNSTGHYVANRSSSSQENGYKNAADQGFVSVTSAAPQNGNIYFLAANKLGTGGFSGSNLQLMIGTIGGSLTSTDVSNLCHQENLYLTTVAGIASGTC
jgi:hypothetical protein